MVNPALKKKHSLKDVNLLPLIKRIRDNKEVELRIQDFARCQGKKIEDLSVQDLRVIFKDVLLCEESLDDILQMSGCSVNLTSARNAVHYSILHANEFGHPKGQQLVDPSVNSDVDDASDAPPVKARRLEQRIKDLEKSKIETVQRLKSKVRSLALQQEPSEALLLITLDELAVAARQSDHDEAEMFEELARQATRYQGKVSIQSLCLSVLGGSAGDRVSKALLKCVKEKTSDFNASGSRDNESASALPTPQTLLSPFANYQPPIMPGYSNPAFGYVFPQTRYSRPYGQPRRGSQRLYVCLFCDNPGHMVKDCEAMQKAKAKK